MGPAFSYSRDIDMACHSCAEHETLGVNTIHCKKHNECKRRGD